MKIFAILSIIILLSVSLAGCVQKKPDELILGRWEGEDDEINYIMEFYNDNTLIIYLYGEKYIGNYVF